MTITIGIAGITGRVGHCTARELLRYENVVVKGYGRDISKVPKKLSEHPRMKLYQGSVDDAESLRSFAKGCKVMICTYLAGNDVMYDGQKLLIDISEEEGTEKYVASDYTVEYMSLKLGQFAMKDPMLKIKDYLETKTIKGVHVLVGSFVESLFSGGLFYWNPEKCEISFYGSGDERLEISSYHTTGQRVAAVALDDTAEGVFRFYDDCVSWNEIISTFSKVYGISPNVQKLGSLEELKAKADANMKENYMLTVIYWISCGLLPFTKPIDSGRYPWIKQTTMEDFFRRYSRDKLQQALPDVISGDT